MKSARRREELRRALRKPGVDFAALFLRRDLVAAVAIFVVYFLAAAWLADFSHSHPRLTVGQVMSETRLKRVSFEVTDEALTREARDAARQRAPHVYRLNEPYLAEIRSALEDLPAVVSGKPLSEIAPELIQQFRLDESRLAMLQQHAVDGKSSDQWQGWVNGNLLGRAVIEHPTLSTRDWQVQNTRVEVPDYIAGDQTIKARATEMDPEKIAENFNHWTVAIRSTGVPDDVAEVMAARLAWRPQPTYLKDEPATAQRAREAAEAVRSITVEHIAGDPIYRRGDILSDVQLAVVEKEADEYRAQTPAAARWAARAGRLGTVGIIVIFMAGYLIRFNPKVVRNPWRVMAIAGVSAMMTGISVWIAVTAPPFVYLVAVSTAMFLSILLVIAYDQRLAATLTGLHAALTAFVLGQSIGFFILLAAVCGAAVAMLRELRHRNSLIRAALCAAIVAAVGGLLLGFLETPLLNGQGDMIAGAVRQIVGRAGLACIGALGVGFLLLGLLPSIERAFDMTTGMTLVELRDPRQPLLRQLQELAPGTHNHSLQVATIAEAAADAVGVDALLAYAGALYHDIGKMNKPDYFVENLSGGPSRHAKLSPAMSLLVIVGHVKDGVELAREYNLPRSIIHFIESHHGTTLVEYFYHAARSKAEQEGERVAEFEFRYPGPKPRTKEAAILMIADACESATRAMDDPGPASIENLVRKLSRKRLKDGQFDECDLTLRELSMIEDSIIKSIWSLHHGRVAYPTGTEETPAPVLTARPEPTPLHVRAPLRTSA